MIISSSFDLTIFRDFSIENSSSEKIEEVIFDRKVNFNEYVTNLWNKNSSTSVNDYAYFLSQIGYLPLV